MCAHLMSIIYINIKILICSLFLYRYFLKNKLSYKNTYLNINYIIQFNIFFNFKNILKNKVKKLKII